jgi:hypothetical protein
MTLYVSGSHGEAHCSETHKVGGWVGKLGEGFMGVEAAEGHRMTRDLDHQVGDTVNWFF